MRVNMGFKAMETRRNSLLHLLGGLQDLEGAKKTLINTHHGTGIVKLSTVVGGAKQGDELAFREELVTILHDLVGTADQVHVMLLQEPRHYIRPEREGYTAVVL